MGIKWNALWKTLGVPRIMNPYFGFLFARPSFVEGVARALDLCGTLQEYNSSPSPEQADALALGADWRVVGADLLRAMDELSEEHKVAINADLMAKARAALAPSTSVSNGR